MSEARKMKVHELAKRRGLPAADVVKILSEGGMEVTSHLNTLWNEDIDKAVDLLNKAQPDYVPPAEPTEEEKPPTLREQGYVMPYLGITRRIVPAENGEPETHWFVEVYLKNPDTDEMMLEKTIECGRLRAKAVQKFHEQIWHNRIRRG